MLTRTCSLAADGFRADFVWAWIGVPGSIDLEVALHLDARYLATSICMPILHADILRLASYLDDHIEALARDPDSEPFTFVPLDCSFQLQAHCGEVRDGDDGEFTVRVMANVTPGGQGTRVYVGCEGVLAVAEARRFTAQLRDLAARLARIPADP